MYFWLRPNAFQFEAAKADQDHGVRLGVFGVLGVQFMVLIASAGKVGKGTGSSGVHLTL